MVLQSTRWLALGYFTYFFSYGIFLPFWSVWLKGIGLTPETIGLLLGAGLVARFLGSLLIAPRVSDPSRLISALRVLALLTLLFAVAFWAGAHVAWLMLVMIGFNLFFSPLVPLTDALANTWQKQFPLDYGKVRLWGSVAFVIGSALTGKLVTMFDYRVILALLTLGVASMLLGFLIRPTIQPQGASRQQESTGWSAWLALFQRGVAANNIADTDTGNEYRAFQSVFAAVGSRDSLTLVDWYRRKSYAQFRAASVHSSGRG